MQNIEIKTPLDDRDAVEKRLEAMGARRVWRRMQRDSFFEVTRGWLKLREADGREPELISYVRPTESSNPRTSDYDVVTVDYAEVWKRLLGRVLDLDAVVEKERTFWLYEHTRIHLDRVKGLGDYLELETVVAGLELADARAETDRVIEALALNPERFIAVPYRELLS